MAYALVVWPALEWLVDEGGWDRTDAVGVLRGRVLGLRLAAAGDRAHVVRRDPARRHGRLMPVAVADAGAPGIRLARHVRRGDRSGHRRGHRRRAGVVPIDSAQVLDVHLWIWPQAVSLFVLGAVGAERGWIWELPRRVRSLCRRGLVGALMALAVLVVLSDGPDGFTGGVHREAAGWAGCEGVLAVSTSLLVLDWSRRHVVAHGRRERSVARSAYGAFVAQGPVLVVIALLHDPLDVPADLRFVVLAVGGVLGSFACGWAAVRLAARGRRAGASG